MRSPVLVTGAVRVLQRKMRVPCVHLSMSRTASAVQAFRDVPLHVDAATRSRRADALPLAFEMPAITAFR